jgi:hypothetical protein
MPHELSILLLDVVLANSEALLSLNQVIQEYLSIHGGTFAHSIEPRQT